MNELIKIENKEINTENVQTVNARELHSFLEVGRDFSNWIKSRLDTLGSLEGQDYIVLKGESLLARFGEQTETTNSRGGHNRLEYFVTLDLAKHLAMMEKNEKGKQIRDYFIECEKQLREVLTPKQTFLLGILEAKDEVSRAIAINQYEVGYVKPLENKVEEQAKAIEVNQPKVRYYDIVLSCSDLLTVTQISQDYGISAQKLNKILNEEGIQYKSKDGVWLLYIQYNAQGYAQTNTVTYQDKDGKYHSKLHLKWTQKGRLFIYDTLKGRGILPVCEQE